MAERHFEIHERVKLLALGYSQSSAVPKTWLELSASQRRDRIEAMRQLVAEKDILDVIARRAEL